MENDIILCLDEVFAAEGMFTEIFSSSGAVIVTYTCTTVRGEVLLQLCSCLNSSRESSPDRPTR